MDYLDFKNQYEASFYPTHNKFPYFFNRGLNERIDPFLHKSQPLYKSQDDHVYTFTNKIKNCNNSASERFYEKFRFRSHGLKENFYKSFNMGRPKGPI